MTTFFKDILNCPYHGWVANKEAGLVQVALNAVSYLPYCHIVTGCMNIFEALALENSRKQNWQRDSNQLMIRGVVTLLGGKPLYLAVDIAKTAYDILRVSYEPSLPLPRQT